MKTNNRPQLHISLSREHSKHQSEIADAFKDFDVTFDAGLMRFSAEEMLMQVVIWVASNVAWDFLKESLKNLHKKFPNIRISLRDNESVMYTVKPDLSVVVIVTPDRAKEFAHIKTIDDLEKYFHRLSQKNMPDGWATQKVSDVFDFINSYAFSRENLVESSENKDGVENIHYGDIHAKFFSTQIDVNKVSLPQIKSEGFAPRKDTLLRDGDLVMADASEDYEGVGICVSVHGVGKKKVVAGLHTFVLRDNKGKTAERYRQYIFRNHEVRRRMQKIANGVSVYSISKSNLSKESVSLPPLPEQNRIVKVLETWDKAIGILAKKIEHKKEIKKGLMQNLLTGKIRLSGFSDEWVEVKLGEVSIFVNGYTFKSSSYLEEGKYKIITIANVQDGFLTTNNASTINDLPGNISNEQMLKKEDILISMTGNVGRVCRVNQENCLLNQRVGKIVPKNITPSLLYLFLSDKHFLNRMIERAQGGAQDNLSTSDIKKYPFIIPKSKEEQTAIANILATSENEISDLEKKLTLLKVQKKFLLNNLITGTIRTPENLTTNSK